MNFDQYVYTVERFFFTAARRHISYLRGHDVSAYTAEAWLGDHLANLYEGKRG